MNACCMFSSDINVDTLPGSKIPGSEEPLRIRPGPPVCSGLGKNGVRRGRHLIHTDRQTYFYNANFIEYPKHCSQRPKFVKIK